MLPLIMYTNLSYFYGKEKNGKNAANYYVSVCVHGVEACVFLK